MEVFLQGASKDLTDNVANLRAGRRGHAAGPVTGGPVPTYDGYLLGYTETISRTDWAFTLHLTPWD